MADASRSEPSDHRFGPGLVSRLPGMAYQCEDDEDWTMRFVSAGGEELTGYAPEDLRDSARVAYADLIHPEDREYVRSAVAEAVSAGEEFDLEYRIRTADGEEKWVWERGSGVYGEGGELLFLEGFISDITRQKTAEREARAAESRFRGLVEQSLVGVYVIEGGRFQYVNPHFAEIFGYEPDELVTEVSPLDLVHPDDRAMVSRHLARRETGDVDSIHYEFKGQRRDGEVVEVEVHGSSLGSGRRTAIIGVLVDRTERNRIHRQYTQAQKLEAVGRLAGGVAHDFNNLLAAILSTAELGLMEGDPDDTRSREFREIAESARRGAAVTRRLLAFSRHEVGERKPVDLNELFRNIDVLLRRLLSEEVTLEWHLHSSDPVAVADRARLEQVIVNLVVNAVDAMPGGGTLTIETGVLVPAELPPDVESDAAPESWATIALSDTGEGIPEGFQEHIFEPFFTTKAEGKGTGLGLFTSYEIVRDHDGDITVESEPASGTTFRIYLPGSSKSADAGEEHSPPAEHLIEGEGTILVIEDDEAVRRVGVRILRRAGYTVREAANASEAIRICDERAESIDLMLVDVILPEIRGPELVATLQSICPVGDVLYMSGYAGNVFSWDDWEVVRDQLIAKPFNSAELTRRVKEAIGRDA